MERLPEAAGSPSAPANTKKAYFGGDGFKGLAELFDLGGQPFQALVLPTS